MQWRQTLKPIRLPMLKHDVMAVDPAILLHGIADAAGVVSHSQTGTPLSVDDRMTMIPPRVAAAMIEKLQPYTGGAQS